MDSLTFYDDDYPSDAKQRVYAARRRHRERRPSGPGRRFHEGRAAAIDARTSEIDDVRPPPTTGTRGDHIKPVFPLGHTYNQSGTFCTCPGSGAARVDMLEGVDESVLPSRGSKWRFTRTQWRWLARSQWTKISRRIYRWFTGVCHDDLWSQGQTLPGNVSVHLKEPVFSRRVVRRDEASLESANLSWTLRRREERVLYENVAYAPLLKNEETEEEDDLNDKPNDYSDDDDFIL